MPIDYSLEFDQNDYYASVDLNAASSFLMAQTEKEKDCQTVGPKLPRYATPELRARVYGFSAHEHAAVGRWIEFLLQQSPQKTDAEAFWINCHVIAWMAKPIETQKELGDRLGVSQQWIGKLVVKISERLSEVSTL